MNTLIPSPEFLLLLGPGILAVMAFLETSLPVGLLVPAGVALALGAFLAREGLLPFPTVLLCAGLGGIAGDWTGYWLGRRREVSIFQRAPGFVGRMARGSAAPTAQAIRNRPFWTITLGRTISFVRTLMPAAVGRSGIPFGTFAAFDLLGVAAWLALYTAVGIVAGASWQAASGVVGTGWALLFLVVGLVVVVGNRLRARHSGPVPGPADPVDG